MELIESSSKKIKGIPKDRLSELPDVLLHKILSYLDLNTKQIIQLSFLFPKRWRNFWISIPYLDLDVCNWDFNRTREKKFLEFVNKVMLQLDGSNLHKFRFACHGFSYESQFKGWITQAVALRVQELYLERLLLPIAFFGCVKVLKLVHVSLSESGLLSSRLVLVKSRLVLDLPEVVCFSIKHCFHGLESFCISAPQLKHLDLDNTMYLPECGIEIRGRNLVSITLQGYMYDSYFIEDLSSLLTAEVSTSIPQGALDRNRTFKHLSSLPINKKQQECLLEVLNAVKAVESLTLSAHNFNKTFPELLYELKVAPIAFHNVTYLSLDEWSKDACENRVDLLVKMFPNVETIVLTKSFSNDSREHLRGTYWRQPELMIGGNWRQVEQSSPECIFYHLKSIELQYFEQYGNVFELLKYLVGKSLSLEIITIKTTTRILKDGENALADTVSRITSLPKASSNVEIVTIVERGRQFSNLFGDPPKASEVPPIITRYQ